MDNFKNKVEVLKRVIIGSLSDEQKIKYFNGSLSDDDYKILSVQSIPEARLYGKDWPTNAHTMIGYQRLTNIENCLVDILNNALSSCYSFLQ